MSGILIAASGPFGRVELDATYTVPDVDAAAATATIKFQNDGTILNQADNQIGTWIVPTAAAPGAYQIRATPNPDTPDGGSGMNTWLALSTSRTWSETRLAAEGDGTTTVVFDIEIRQGTGPVLATTTVTLSATIF